MEKNKVERILIVGATSGIGEGLARLYAGRSGIKVGIMGRRAGRLEALRTSRPEVFEAEACDVTDTEAVPAALERLAARMGGVDVLVLSSGTGDLNPALDYAVEHRTIAVNVAGWTCVADWAIRYFERQGKGHLAAITSTGGLRGSGAAPAYNATKAFQMNYLEGLRQRLAGKGLPVFVTDIRPGFVDTAMAKGEGLFWVAPVDKACRQMARSIDKRHKVAYVTQRWKLAAGIYRHIPDGMYAKMMKG